MDSYLRTVQTECEAMRMVGKFKFNSDRQHTHRRALVKVIESIGFAS